MLQIYPCNNDKYYKKSVISISAPDTVQYWNSSV